MEYKLQTRKIGPPEASSVLPHFYGFHKTILTKTIPKPNALVGFQNQDREEKLRTDSPPKKATWAVPGILYYTILQHTILYTTPYYNMPYYTISYYIPYYTIQYHTPNQTITTGLGPRKQLQSFPWPASQWFGLLTARRDSGVWSSTSWRILSGQAQ